MGLFSLDLPPGWRFFPDENGGGVIPPESDAILHFHSERVADPADLPNLSRMLAGFVTLHHRPVPTDELLRLQIQGATAFAWRYQEDDGTVVRLWVAGTEEAWVFVNFQANQETAERLAPAVDAILASLRIGGRIPDPPG